MPFPSKVAVFTDETGTPRVDLPASAEPLRLLYLDFPWCPPCADAWKAVADASRSVPGGRVRVYRILFDREKFDTARGTAETAPMRRAPAPPELAFPVTTLTALPVAFRERYRVEQAPTLLLADASGTILKRWVGYFPGLSESIRDEISRNRK